MNSEPALIVAAITALLNVAAAFVPSITPLQLGALNAAVVAIAGVITRQQVYAPDTVDQLTRPS
ncbi:MAG TPA: hypothetical protein VIW26_03490 [Gemmatimonadales bacterium]|jgi:hypothetical protein